MLFRSKVTKPIALKKVMPKHTMVAFSLEHNVEAMKLPNGVVEFEEHHFGCNRGEPLIVIMDSLLRYAKAYRVQYESPLSSDGYLGIVWLAAIKNARLLLNGYGAVAMELGRSTDSKSNGVIEALYWKAIKVAGYSNNEGE